MAPQTNSEIRSVLHILVLLRPKFSEKNTKVIEMYNLILKEDGDRQQTWYTSGIGTYAKPSWKSLRYYKKYSFTRSI